jgi:hypothetical protein
VKGTPASNKFDLVQNGLGESILAHNLYPGGPMSEMFRVLFHSLFSTLASKLNVLHQSALA